jgi:hypothetical protein
VPVALPLRALRRVPHRRPPPVVFIACALPRSLDRFLARLFEPTPETAGHSAHAHDRWSDARPPGAELPGPRAARKARAQPENDRLIRKVV